MPRGPLHKVSLYKRLLGLSMQEGGSVVHHLNEFSEVTEKLLETGIEFQEELLAIMLLSSLSKEFDNFVVAMETRDNLPNFSLLKQKILEEGKRKREQDESEKASTQQQAFAAQPKNKEFNRKDNNRKNFKKQFKGKCYVCGVTGHYANKCDKRGEKQQEKQQALTMLAATEASSLQKELWYVDSGATSHMCNNRNIFTHISDHIEVIALAGDKQITAVGKGDVVIHNSGFELLLENVLYSPELQANFISVSKAVDRGLSVKFNSKKAVMTRSDSTVVLQAVRQNNMFIARNEKEKLFAASSATLWHKRYGHLNFDSLSQLSNKNMVNGMKVNKVSNAKCKTCMLSKIHVLPFPSVSDNRSSRILDVIHTDVYGPFRTRSIGGSKYFVTFIDDKSRMIFVYFMKSKSEVFDKFKVFKAMVE